MSRFAKVLGVVVPNFGRSNRGIEGKGVGRIEMQDVKIFKARGKKESFGRMSFQE